MKTQKRLTVHQFWIWSFILSNGFVGGCSHESPKSFPVPTTSKLTIERDAEHLLSLSISKLKIGSNGSATFCVRNISKHDVMISKKIECGGFFVSESKFYITGTTYFVHEPQSRNEYVLLSPRNSHSSSEDEIKFEVPIPTVDAFAMGASDLHLVATAFLYVATCDSEMIWSLAKVELNVSAQK